MWLFVTVDDAISLSTQVMEAIDADDELYECVNSENESGVLYYSTLFIMWYLVSIVGGFGISNSSLVLKVHSNPFVYVQCISVNIEFFCHNCV